MKSFQIFMIFNKNYCHFS